MCYRKKYLEVNGNVSIRQGKINGTARGSSSPTRVVSREKRGKKKINKCK